MKFLLFHEKNADRYFPAETLEELDVQARKILCTRFGEGWYSDDDEYFYKQVTAIAENPDKSTVYINEFGDKSFSLAFKLLQRRQNYEYEGFDIGESS